jgi:hypothetical protein
MPLAGVDGAQGTAGLGGKLALPALAGGSGAPPGAAGLGWPGYACLCRDAVTDGRELHGIRVLTVILVADDDRAGARGLAGELRRCGLDPVHRSGHHHAQGHDTLIRRVNPDTLPSSMDLIGDIPE